MIKQIQYLFPTIVAKKIYRLMSNPRIKKLRDSEEDTLNTAIKESIKYNEAHLMRYEWGKENKKTALLVHGWEGQTGNFVSLIPTLLNTGYRVISIDAPSHGKSSTTKTNMFELSSILIPHFKKERPELVISHSFGSVNMARVLRLCPDISIKYWFLVTTPHTFKSRIDEMARKFSINQTVIKKLIKNIEADVNENINDLNMVTYCSELQNVEKAFIIHSKKDKVLPIDGAREVNLSFKQSELIELDNYGHYSILWSEELHNILSNQLLKN